MQHEIQEKLWDEAVRYAEDHILKPLLPDFKKKHDFSLRGHRIMWSTTLLARFFYAVNYEFLEANAQKIRADPDEFSRLADISRERIGTLKSVLGTWLDPLVGRAFEALFECVETQASEDRKRSYLKMLEKEFSADDQLEFVAETDRRYWQFLMESSNASYCSEADRESLLNMFREAARLTLLENQEAKAKAEAMAEEILMRGKPKGFG